MTHRRTVSTLLAGWLCLVTQSGCTNRVEVSVQVLTDLRPGVDFDGIALEVDDAVVVTRAVDLTSRFDRPYILAELDDLARDRAVRLGARLLLREVPVVSRAVATRFDTSRVVLFFLSSECVAVRCPTEGGDPEATECEDGECVRPLCQGASCSPDAGVPAEEDALDVDAPTMDAACAPVVDPCVDVTCSGAGWCDLGACFCDPGSAGIACEACEGGWSSAALAPCAPAVPVEGTPGPDALSGTPMDDFLRGLDGNDTISGGDGDDLVSGNDGLDTVEGNAGRDVVYGGNHVDHLFGGSSDDYLVGDDGDDVIFGGAGSDRIVGGSGDDRLFGEDEDGTGPGNDRYVLDGRGQDEIIDLSGDDDAARCRRGIVVVSESREGADRTLRFSSGGSVILRGDTVERILGCGCAL